LGGDEDHRGLEGGLAAERDAEQARQERDVLGRQGMPAGAEGVEGLAVAEEDGLLALLDDELAAETDGRGAVGGYPRHHGAAGGILVLDHLHGSDLLRSQAPAPAWTTLLITSSRCFHLSSRVRACWRMRSRAPAGSSEPGAGRAATALPSPAKSSSTARSNS